MDSQEEAKPTALAQAEVTSPAPAVATDVSTAPVPVPAPAPAAKSGRLLNALTDLCLVAMTAAVIGGGAWYLNEQMKLYNIPSPLELAMQENEKLAQKQQSLEKESFLADEQSRLRERYAMLQKQLQEVNQATSDKLAKLEASQGNILALQHEIRQADRDARNMARNQLLPGMMVGVIRTKKGQVYNGAIIRGIDGKLITIRHDSGQARFNMNLLVTESLPTIVRYAFGLEELVDTSDFQSSDAPSSKKTSKPTTTSKPSPAAQTKTVTSVQTHAFASYDPAPGVPVVDGTTPAPSTGNSSPAPAYQAPAPTNGWSAPSDPLPL